MTGRLAGKVALVCGAGSGGPGWGNGKATAVAFAREGARVLAVDRDMAAAEETAAIIAGEGFEAGAHAADIADGTQVAAMVAACIARYGRVDVLHNNVGIAGPGDPISTPEDLWTQVMQVNVTGLFLTCKHVLPHFLAQGGGAIVNVSSLSALKAVRPEIAYATSKGAVNAFTVNLAMTYADRNIRCNAILPGLINTPMVAGFLRREAGSDGELDAMLRQRDAASPTGHMGEAWDVANAAVFLASDEARYINGVLLPVDAGLQHGTIVNNE